MFLDILISVFNLRIGFTVSSISAMIDFFFIQLTFIYLAIMFWTNVINYRYANFFEWCCKCV